MATMGADGAEVVGLHVAPVHHAQHFVERLLRSQRGCREAVAVVVEGNHRAEEDVEDVGRVVLLLRLVLHVDGFEIAHAVERGVAEESEEFLVLALNVDVVDESVYGVRRAEILGDFVCFCCAVGIFHTGFSVGYGDGGQRVDADERA